MAALLLRRQTKREARTDKVSRGKGSAQSEPGGCSLWRRFDRGAAEESDGQQLKQEFPDGRDT